MSERQVGIYVLTHTASNTAYVGSGLDPRYRIGSHLSGTGANSTANWLEDICPEWPTWRIRDWCDEPDRVLVEEAWIHHYAYVLGYEMVNGTRRVWPIDSEAASKGGRIGGLLTGSANVRKMHTHPNYRSGGLKGGRRVHELHPDLAAQNMRKAIATMKAEGTHLENCAKAGRKGARRLHELYPDLSSENGQKSWRKMIAHPNWHEGCVKGGRRSHELHPNMARDNGRKMGAINGRKAIARLKDEDKWTEISAKGGRKGGRTTGNLYRGRATHMRWHTNRDIFRQACGYCVLDTTLDRLMWADE